MNDDMYKVEYEDYLGFVNQLKKGIFNSKVEEYDTKKRLEIISNKTGKVLAAQEVYSNEENAFFIYEMPDDDERRAPPKVRKIVLETEEEVKAFFELLNKAVKKDE